ncbi:MAG: hypothetical protein WCG87_02720 [Bacteroidota bacterium]
MKRYLRYILLSCCCLVVLTPVYAQPKKEEDLINAILTCLEHKDSVSYVSLFPEFAQIWAMANDAKSADYDEMAYLRVHPEALRQLDPNFNKEIGNGFNSLLQQGKTLGLHWEKIARVSFELERMKETKDIKGINKIATNRLRGYVFILDELSQKRYAFTTSELMSIKGKWYGGRLTYIFEASNKDAFMEKLNLVIKNKGQLPKDTTAEVDSTDKQQDEITIPKRRIIVDRKYYSGKFDNEIPVKLYVRYLKVPGCKDEACAWESIFKFGEEDYVRMKVTKNEKGAWLFSDEAVPGSMELILKGNIYTGTWTTNEDQTGYDAKLTETPITPKKTEQLDNILEEDIAPGKSANNVTY